MAVVGSTPTLQTLGRGRSVDAFELVDEWFPLLLTRVAGPMGPARVLALLRFLDAAVTRGLAEGQVLVHICDVQFVTPPDGLVRAMLIDWLSGRSPVQRDVILGSRVITSDPLVRGMIVSLRWATGRGDGIELVRTHAEAETSARELLLRHGLPVPEALVGAQTGTGTVATSSRTSS